MHKATSLAPRCKGKGTAGYSHCPAPHLASKCSAAKLTSQLGEALKVKPLSRVQLFVTPWTVAYQAPLSIAFSRQEYWSGLTFLPPGDLPDPRIEARSPAL